MANIKTPDGGFYLDDSEFNVDYQTNVVTLTGGGSSGEYLSLDGGMMNPDAVISGEDTLEISLASGSQSAVIGLSAEGTTISNESSNVPTASIRVIENVIEIKANDTTLTVNGTGVDFGSGALKNVNSISSTDGLAIEVDMDMNSHKITELADPTDNNDAANKQYVDSKIPALATVTTAGIVKEIPNIEQFTNPSSATAQEIADKFNNLIQNLINAGIMVAGT